MDFSIPPKIQELKQRFTAFIEQEVLPLEPVFLAQDFETLTGQLQEVRQKAKEQGLWAPHFAKEYGGMGLSLMEFAHVSEVLGRSLLGHVSVNSQAPDVGNMEILHHFGTEEQKERWLTPLVAGEARSCFAMTEPEFAGANPVRMGTMAVKEGDEYVLNGHKWFTTAADGADFAIVMAVTDPDGEKYQKASQIIVPLDTPGYEMVRNIQVMGEAGHAFASHAEIRLTDVRVPQSNLLGGEGAGFAIAQERLGPGRIHHCMRWIGICERVLSLMCERAATRELSPGKPLGTRQTVQNWIAESRAEINAARLMVLHTAWKIDTEGTYAAREEISLIKFSVADTLQKVLDRALQTHGALGMTDDTPIAWWFRHERAARIYDGPDEVHKTVVARRMLRPYGIQVR